MDVAMSFLSIVKQLVNGAGNEAGLRQRARPQLNMTVKLIVTACVSPTLRVGAGVGTPRANLIVGRGVGSGVGAVAGALVVGNTLFTGENTPRMALPTVARGLPGVVPLPETPGVVRRELTKHGRGTRGPPLVCVVDVHDGNMLLVINV
jgi:hypothetical protein